MAKVKTPPHKVVMTEGKSEIIKPLLSEYGIQSVQDIQEALKALLGGTIKKLWKLRWRSTWDMKNLSVLTAMISETVTSQRL